ncbi:hypothetical protein Poly51_39290 [Rubripirellula tenax]|uniref:DUF1552 domain-containing protein n=1 Tax=Rubripirellula tenax TaxID=2528015 RepID=A0A5C6ESS9_9BACT|nr:DUF1552 domain-containing protein [Rubripirellula tenax]TWU50636.1 hypothetical protein Poly51_39290 [Rubripirellula tenax]
MSVDDDFIDRILEGAASTEEAGEFQRWLEFPAILERFALRAELHSDLHRSLRRRRIQKSALEASTDAAVAESVSSPEKTPVAAFHSRRMLGLSATGIAVETDSTRLISIYIHQNDAKPNIAGVDTGTHPLTHHGNQPEKLDQLRLIEEAQFKELAGLLGGLAGSAAADGSLLDQTSVIYGTSLGNGNSHANNNLPVLIAGGGFRHAQHLKLGEDQDYPLPNLFVSVLQRLGIETDKFATSTGTMRGLGLA